MIESLVEQIEARFAELERQMSDPAVIADRERYAEVGREYRELEPAHALAREYAVLRDDLEGAREPWPTTGTTLSFASSWLKGRPGSLSSASRFAWRPWRRTRTTRRTSWSRSGPARAATKPALFAGDLFQMLTRYAEERGFATEVLSQSPAEIGGFKEVTFAVKGDGAYSVFKYEAGTHRVQRVPKTESQGRIHTSTATVAVLPEAEEVEVEIDPNDLQVDVYRSSGPGASTSTRPTPPSG